MVTAITENDLRDTFAVRKILETMAIKLVCEKITIDSLEKLKAYVENHQQAIDKSIKYNSRSTKKPAIDPTWSALFHSELYVSCGNSRLIRYIEELRDLQRLVYVSKKFTEDDYSLFYEQHRNLLDAIERNDQEDAVKAVEAHLDTMFHIYLQSL